MRLAWLLVLLAACHHAGGTCPSTLPPLGADAAIRLTGGAPGEEVVVARTRDAALAATAGLARAPGPAADPRAGMPAGAAPTMAPDEAADLARFVGATDFTADAVALVRMGGARQVVRGVTRDGAVVTFHLGSTCAPCGGGDRGSYEDAQAAYAAESAPATLLARVPRGATVEVATCAPPTCACRTDIP